MSQENVEIVRRFFRELAADMDAVVEHWHSDLDYRAMEGAPDDIGVFHGHEALRHYYQQWSEILDDFGVQAERLIEAGEKKVVAAVYVSGRMKGSDPASAVIGMRFGVVFTLRDGKIISGREYATGRQALEAAGLSE